MKVTYKICGWGHPRNQYIWKETQTFEVQFPMMGKDYWGRLDKKGSNLGGASNLRDILGFPKLHLDPASQPAL